MRTGACQEFAEPRAGYSPSPNLLCATCKQPRSAHTAVTQAVYESAVKGRQDFRQVVREMRERSAFGPDTSTDDATWVLCLIQDQQITVSKGREWLREWIHNGIKGPLPGDR